MIRPLALLFFFAFAVFAQSATVVEQAEQAVAEGVPQVAIVKLKAELAKAKLTATERERANWLLAEAQLHSGSPKDALATIATLPNRTETEKLLLRANIEAAAGQWNSAFRRYQELSTRPDAPIAAVLGETESLQALGRTVEAINTLRRALPKREFPPAAFLRLASLFVEVDRPEDARKAIAAAKASSLADKKWQSHLEARIQLLEKNPKAAQAILETLLADRAGLSENLVAAATLAMAEAQLALLGTDAAEKTLITFIHQYPESSQLELIFRRLDQIYATDKNPTERELHGFAKDVAKRSAALAQFYVIRMQFRADLFAKTQLSLAYFFSKFPNSELIPYVHQVQADLHKAMENLPEAEKSYDAASRAAKIPEVRAESALEAALVNLRQGQFERATPRLASAKAFPRLKLTASYNIALGWLWQQNYARFREELASFATQFQSTRLVGQLRLEEGLVQARNSQPAAMETLQLFLRDFPDHERKGEAQIAMAELAFLRGQDQKAEALLAAVKNDPTQPANAEQAEYLAVFLADKKQPRETAEVIRLARGFISRHPNSPMISEVRMKLGQIYFAEEDFLKAQEQFESLATSDPKSIYSEMALFLAGQCGMRMMNTNALNHALEVFDKVAERKGPLETRARLQQALIKNKLGAEDDAVKIYDAIISSPAAVDPEVRYAALVGKGDNLTALAQDHEANDPLRKKALEDAVQTYNQLIGAKDAPPSWVNQAAYKKGKALLQLGKNEDALAEFSDVVNRNTANARETFWFAKAGFDGAALLESQQKWKEAVALYDKMALVPGPHVAQAKLRVKSLRLEYFLWD